MKIGNDPHIDFSDSILREGYIYLSEKERQDTGWEISFFNDDKISSNSLKLLHLTTNEFRLLRSGESLNDSVILVYCTLCQDALHRKADSKIIDIDSAERAQKTFSSIETLSSDSRQKYGLVSSNPRDRVITTESHITRTQSRTQTTFFGPFVVLTCTGSWSTGLHQLREFPVTMGWEWRYQKGANLRLHPGCPTYTHRSGTSQLKFNQPTRKWKVLIVG